ALFLAALFANLVHGLALGKPQQQRPEVVAVAQQGKAALLDAPAEAGEGAEGDVLLVGGGAGRAREFLAGQGDEPAEVALPEELGGVRVAGLELAEPLGDGAGRRHGRSPRTALHGRLTSRHPRGRTPPTT